MITNTINCDMCGYKAGSNNLSTPDDYGWFTLHSTTIACDLHFCSKRCVYEYFKHDYCRLVKNEAGDVVAYAEA